MMIKPGETLLKATCKKCGTRLYRDACFHKYRPYCGEWCWRWGQLIKLRSAQDKTINVQAK